MHIRRTLPPAAAPIYARNILFGLRHFLRRFEELGRFKHELQEYFNVRHCFLLCSGKASLTILLKALKELYPQRDEVLIPAYTCYSVPSAVVRAGLKIQLCDLDPQTLDFDFNQLSEIFKASDSTNLSDSINTKKLLAVIPVHLFGIPCDIERLKNLICDPEIAVIEDAAQAMGGERAGRKVGTIGDAGFFSLGRGKALSTVEGGIIITNRKDIAEKVNALLAGVSPYRCTDLLSLVCKTIVLYFFLHPLSFWLPKSLHFLKLGQTLYDPCFKMKKMSFFQASLSRFWRIHLRKYQDSRSKNIKLWSSILKDIKGMRQFPITQVIQQTQRTSYVQDGPQNATSPIDPLPPLIRFPVFVTESALRDKIIQASDQLGLGLMPGYPDSINNIPEIKKLFLGQAFPAAKSLAEGLITFPIHVFVSEKDIQKTADLLSKLTQRLP